jgi:hypothetical protein
MWSSYDWVVIYDHILCLLMDDNDNPIIMRPHIVFTDGRQWLPNHNTTTYCVLNTICGRVMIGVSLLSSVSKHNMWSHYDCVVVSPTRPTVRKRCDWKYNLGDLEMSFLFVSGITWPEVSDTVPGFFPPPKYPTCHSTSHLQQRSFNAALKWHKSGSFPGRAMDFDHIKKCKPVPTVNSGTVSFKCSIEASLL